MDIPLFRGSAGINNKVDPTRIRFNPKTRIQDLAVGVNVDIDDTGRVFRRKGSTRRTTDDAHSMFSCGQYALFVTGTDLSVFEKDYSTSAIATVTTGARMSYAKVGNVIYCMNNHEKWTVTDRVASNWTGLDYVGPTTTKTFSDPPIGHLVEIFNGHAYVAQSAFDQHVIWYSQPFAYSWFDLARAYMPFENRITLIRAVIDGMYVSDTENTYFLSGMVPKEMGPVKVADYPAIEGTDVMVQGSRIGEGVSGEVVMWASKEGICMGGPQGQFRNLTERRLTYPDANYGSGLYRNGKYLALLAP